ncbi:N-acylglucosamine 2-epimerase [Balamuthia mandrillaris]
MACGIAEAKEYAQQYRQALFAEVIPFWTRHSLDDEFGGYFTCLDRTGNVFDTDKFLWLQARQVWMYSKLYNNVDVEKEKEFVSAATKQQWLDIARQGADFLRKHGKDEDGNFYFSLTRQGQPIIHPYNIFSDFFACMAFAQYFKASGEQWALHLTTSTFWNIQRRKQDPKGHWNKTISSTRSFRSLSFPMIELNLCMELLEIESLAQKEEGGGEQFQKMISLAHEKVGESLDELLDTFVDGECGLLHENVSEKNEDMDTFEGRLINPGHSIECLWFIMAAARKAGNQEKVIERAADLMLKTLDFGWDKEYGGIFYFMDLKGKPPQQLEWDQKLWWVHIETLIALSQAYLLTRRDEFMEWYRRVHDYSWPRFTDAEHKGEWFGYLNRRGERLLELKGGKWKGCFHVPRGFWLCYNLFSEIASSSSS